MRRAALFLLVCVAAVAQPRVRNGRVEQRPVDGSLEAAVKRIADSQTAPVWIGYEVAAVSGERTMCCYHNSDGQTYTGCALEEGGERRAGGQAAAGPVRLERPVAIHVLLRIEQRQVSKIRVFSADCELDATATSLYWLTGVDPAASIQFLTTQAATAPDRRTDSAITAIALHATPAATAALDAFLAAGQPEAMRKRAAFWLGVRGRDGVERARRVIATDASDKVRESAITGLATQAGEVAVPLLIEVAKNDASASNRGHALFWLAQKAGKAAVSTIASAVADDPEVKVKERAVFALSQLPNREGVPLLIDVARTHKNPEIRKKAMFWLGQSKDPRALAFFEQILTR